ncbi:MAG: DUF3696 domain-containing protein [Magnetococcales bacterium]|nr:DUF3696 domain-containing protein [Magnetococcales bacterium]
MIKCIHLASFKCFDALSLPLASLTLLTGFNASGKSTAIQGILLPAQGARAGSTSPRLSLNGPLVRLGTAGEVLHSDQGEMSLAVEDEQGNRIGWTLRAVDRQSSSIMTIARATIQAGGKTTTHEQDLHELMLETGYPDDVRPLLRSVKEIVFISAVRSGTREIFPVFEPNHVIHADVGTEGEFAPWWFAQYSDDTVHKERCHPKEQAPTLRKQLNAWLGELFPGAQADAQVISRTSWVRLLLRTSENGNWYRPANIGYGLTYVFPIILAGLLAKEGQVLVIDSPEAHLHPMGQSRMGYFLATMAAAGVQVLIETHSDHVLNGVRIAVKDRKIAPDRVALHFFQSPANQSAQVTYLQIDGQGHVSGWPAGFFDQAEKDLANLAGWDDAP